jgi:hypothetical protein
MTHTPLRPVHSASAAPGAASGAEPGDRRASRRPRWPWIAGGVLAVVAAGVGVFALTGGDDRAAENRPAANADGETNGKTNGGATTLSAAGAEGSLAFTATSIECGIATVGPEELPQRATGQFCLAGVSVRNTGTEAALLDPGAQRAVDGQGREHAVADQAGVFLNDQKPSLLDEIAPGAEVRGVLAFDVPAGERLTALKLHESMGSTGVRVPLS